MSHHQNDILREMQYEHLQAEEEERKRLKLDYDNLFDADFNLNHVRRNFYTLEELILNQKI